MPAATTRRSSTSSPRPTSPAVCTRAIPRSWPAPSPWRRRSGVAVGAHPGFPDLWGFGRRRIPFSPDEIERLVAYQVGAAQALAAYAGHRITYVKAHGALGNIAAEERSVADAIARAVRAVDPRPRPARHRAERAGGGGRGGGLEVHQEIFADRGYTEDGLLIPRSQPGALITEPGRGRRPGPAHGPGGRRSSRHRAGTLPTPIRSICVHGDSAHAVATARAVRDPAGGRRRDAGAVPAVSAAWTNPASSTRARRPWWSSSAPRSIPRSATGSWPSTTPSAPTRPRACGSVCRPTAP